MADGNSSRSGAREKSSSISEISTKSVASSTLEDWLVSMVGDLFGVTESEKTATISQIDTSASSLSTSSTGSNTSSTTSEAKDGNAPSPSTPKKDDEKGDIQKTATRAPSTSGTQSYTTMPVPGFVTISKQKATRSARAVRAQASEFPLSPSELIAAIESGGGPRPTINLNLNNVNSLPDERRSYIDNWVECQREETIQKRKADELEDPDSFLDCILLTDTSTLRRSKRIRSKLLG